MRIHSGRGALKITTVACLSVLVVVLVNGLFFRTPAYHGLLDPDSTTGLFESMISRLRALPSDRRRDVLVLGDSRMYSGFDVDKADANAKGLHFINGAIPGTTPRCWPFLMRAVDPGADRYRAIVVPVDTFSDDDSAIGAIDGNERRQDLHYIVYQVGIGDIPSLARGFRGYSAIAAVDLLLRGPILRDDLQNLLVAPRARFATLRRSSTHPSADPFTRLRTGTLSGMRVDFARNRIFYPPRVDQPERIEIARQVLRIPRPSAPYSAYRREWLGELLHRYRSTETDIIFVRIPTRPIHRNAGMPFSGSLLSLAGDGAEVFPQDAYLALERPELFDDHDHLNVAGAMQFSRLLAREVWKWLRAPAARSHSSAAPPNAAHAKPELRSPAKPKLLSPAKPELRSPAKPKLLSPAKPKLTWSNLRSLFAWGTPLYFQSYEFFIFLALVVSLFYAAPRCIKPLVLLFASYYFYASWNSWYLVFIAALTASDYVVALAMDGRTGRQRSLLLASGIAANLGFLGVFKYANFAGESFATLFHMNQPWTFYWIVPIGISFHTFQSISYVVDVYKRSIRPVRNPIDYALYIAFFPQLLAGPIVRARLFFRELAALEPPRADAVLTGSGQILLGLVKKTVLADPFAHVADTYFGAIAAHPGAPAAWSGALAFAMQIYFDFSGYSDIAIGCARLFGFEFPANFRRPYFAISITDFWHRWNISLSTWLRDYVYIPLGGNQHGKVATYRNLLITMLLGGLWHGANWTFVAWGAYHGLLLAIERRLGYGRPSVQQNALLRATRVILTFVLVTFGWVLFRAPNFHDAFRVAYQMVAGGSGPWLIAPSQIGLVAVALGIGLLVERGAFTPLRWPRLVQAGAFATLLVALELLARPGDVTPFVYFKF